MQFSPVGPRYILATASDDGVARIWTWDPVSKEFTQIRELKVTGPGLNADQQTIANRAIRSIHFSPDGRSLLTVGAWALPEFWQLANSTMTAYDVNDPVTLTCGVFSPDGKWIVVGGDDKLARMWKVGGMADAPIVFHRARRSHRRHPSPDGRVHTTTSPDSVARKSARVLGPQNRQSRQVGS